MKYTSKNIDLVYGARLKTKNCVKNGNLSMIVLIKWVC